MLKQYYPGGFAGYDPSGSPVWLIPFGGADMRGFMTFLNKIFFHLWIILEELGSISARVLSNQSVRACESGTFLLLGVSGTEQ